MGQEPNPAEGQEPEATPSAAPKGAPKTYDEDYVKGLRSEAAANRKAAAELRERLEAIEARDMSESEKLQRERDSLKSEVDPLKSEGLRLRVALDKKLPADLIDRLRGDNEEDLAADADKLLELFGQTPAATPLEVPSFDGGARSEVTPPADPEQQHQDLLVRALTGQSTP
jgi:hypothetical protein